MADWNSEEDARYKDLQNQKFEPPATTRNDRIRLAVFLGGILLGGFSILIFVLSKIF